MPVLRRTKSPLLLCMLLLVGCPGPTQLCPEATVTPDPVEIPAGLSETDVFVEISNPNPENGLEVITELTAISGSFGDPFALQTTYACAHDVSGPVEICVNAIYEGGTGGPDAGMPEGGMPDGGVPEGGMPEAGVDLVPPNQEGNVAASYQYFGAPHVRLGNTLSCSSTKCATVICPGEKNECPVVSSLTVDPMVVPDGNTASVTVVANDPDNNPETLVTMLVATHGTIADPSALDTTYTCDPNVGGVIEICAVASDGDASCDDELCTTVRCPGDPLENTCPVIENLTATPMTIPTDETTASIRVTAMDPDNFPMPLRTELSAGTGVFDNRFVAQTTFHCGESGPVEICVEASDGDRACDKTSCITVQCPSTIPFNVCPMLFVINSIPRVIPAGQTMTMVETRAQDTDALPIPLELTLRALWGTLENTENIQEPNNVVSQNATYICDRPGQVEVCVDATDGACLKTQCDIITCPSDITPP